MLDDAWRGIIIRSIPPSAKWLLVIPLLYPMTKSSDDRTGICVCMDIAISAYYFCILKILCTLYWIYSQYSDKCWTCNGSLQVPYRVIQDCCLDYFLWSLLGRVSREINRQAPYSCTVLSPYSLIACVCLQAKITVFKLAAVNSPDLTLDLLTVGAVGIVVAEMW